MNNLTIKIIIADRPYSLTIADEKEEEAVREAAKILNNTIKKFSDNYAYNDKQDLLAMAALQYATVNLDLEKKISFKDKLLEKKLSEIDNILTEIF
ncbi:MAG: cell division protein ZapA [Bacteroidales bacterium]|nr:cell division protein ZapA [Bacteroidales bacterium]